MSNEALALLILAVLAVAFLYSSVGHAGASGYIAVMSLLGLAPAAIKPTALVLNILVASVAAWQYWRAGCFSWRLFWPFAALSIPLAFVGGYLNLPAHLFKVLVGGILILSAAHLLLRPAADDHPHDPPRSAALAAGAGIGFLSGLTGTGGGIFLTPLLLSMRWARASVASGMSAVLILANSLSGLFGNLGATREVPTFALPLAIAAASGGFIGSYLGSRRLRHDAIKRLLAVVLVVAGLKLILA